MRSCFVWVEGPQIGSSPVSTLDPESRLPPILCISPRLRPTEAAVLFFSFERERPRPTKLPARVRARCVFELAHVVHLSEKGYFDDPGCVRGS